MKKALLFPYVFVAMNWAVLAGLAHYLKGAGEVWTRPAGTLRPDLRSPQPWS